MIRDELSWDELFILQASLIAQKSKDPSTKVGCVIVNDDNVILSTGFNGFPRGIEEDWKDRWKRPESITGLNTLNATQSSMLLALVYHSTTHAHT
jgi:deoxycytidylate deaminase